MKGKILQYNPQEKNGIILGNDGNRYNFDYQIHWIRRNQEIIDDMEVDFIENDSFATEIFPLNIENILKNKQHNIKKINFEEIENTVNNINSFSEYKKEQNKEIKRIFKKNLKIFVPLFILFYISMLLKNDTMGMIIFIGFLFYGIYFLSSILSILYLLASKQEYHYEGYLRAQIFRLYKENLSILNFIPDNLNYEVIKMIEDSSSTYESAKNGLIREAYELKADAIINLNHNSSKSSSVSTQQTLTSGKEIKTSVVSEHNIQGIAIKLL